MRTDLVGLVLRPGDLARARADALARRGVRVVSVEQARGDARIAEGSGIAIVGGPDAWQQEWRLLSEVRAHHDLVIDAACAAEYRLLSGDGLFRPTAARCVALVAVSAPRSFHPSARCCRNLRPEASDDGADLSDGASASRTARRQPFGRAGDPVGGQGARAFEQAQRHDPGGTSAAVEILDRRCRSSARP